MPNLSWDKLLSDKTLKERTALDKKTDARSPFESDYDRIVFSAPFRRLQDKAQLFPLEKNDFVRTRLTHSLEVAAIARSLGITVCNLIDEQKKDCYNWNPEYKSYIPVILETAGLIHDLGNPPFGHGGERVIQDYFKNFFKKNKNLLNNKRLRGDFTNFDGNVQTFRIVTHLQCINDLCGYHLTSALLATIMKYPVPSECIRKTNDIRLKKFGYFYAERNEAVKVFENTGLYQKPVCIRHPLTYLLEAADDIAYCAGDIEDGFKKKIVSLHNLRNFFLCFAKDKEKNGTVPVEKLEKIYEVIRNINAIDTEYVSDGDAHTDPKFDESLTKYVPDSFITDEKRIQRIRIVIQGILTKSVTESFIKEYDSLMSGTYNKELLLDSDAKYVRLALKDFSKEYLISNEDVVKTEVEGATVLKNLLDIFLSKLPDIENIVNFTSSARFSETMEHDQILISSDFTEIFLKTVDGLIDGNHMSNRQKQRLVQYYYLLLVTDFISGMTDTYCISFYRKLNGIDIY